MKSWKRTGACMLAVVLAAMAGTFNVHASEAAEKKTIQYYEAPAGENIVLDGVAQNLAGVEEIKLNAGAAAQMSGIQAGELTSDSAVAILSNQSVVDKAYLFGHSVLYITEGSEVKKTIIGENATVYTTMKVILPKQAGGASAFAQFAKESPAPEGTEIYLIVRITNAAGKEMVVPFDAELLRQLFAGNDKDINIPENPADLESWRKLLGALTYGMDINGLKFEIVGLVLDVEGSGIGLDEFGGSDILMQLILDALKEGKLYIVNGEELKNFSSLDKETQENIKKIIEQLEEERLRREEEKRELPPDYVPEQEETNEPVTPDNITVTG